MSFDMYNTYVFDGKYVEINCDYIYSTKRSWLTTQFISGWTYRELWSLLPPLKTNENAFPLFIVGLD